MIPLWKNEKYEKRLQGNFNAWQFPINISHRNIERMESYSPEHQIICVILTELQVQEKDLGNFQTSYLCICS